MDQEMVDAADFGIGYPVDLHSHMALFLLSGGLNGGDGQYGTHIRR